MPTTFLETFVSPAQTTPGLHAAGTSTFEAARPVGVVQLCVQGILTYLVTLDACVRPSSDVHTPINA